MSRTVITFGTFDLLHIGHINILRRAKQLGSRLVVGVSTDDLNMRKKNIFPVYSQKDRCAIIESIRFVDQVFLEESLDLKRKYIIDFKADVLVMGDDWEGKFDFVKDVCEVVYLTRTPFVSTTSIKQNIATTSTLDNQI